MEPSTPDPGSAPGGTLLVGLPGPNLDSGTARRLAGLAPAGVILFRRNLSSPEQTRDLIADLRAMLPRRAIVAVDQEGGPVSRLEPFVGRTPSAATLARAGTTSTHRFALATGAALRSLGFNLDFAPVVDLCTPDAANGIGARSFGLDPERTTTLAAAYLGGLAEAGIAGCLKHFPGLGATVVDSHVLRPRVERTAKDLASSDLVPFRRLVPVAPAVMIGHGHYPSLDPTPGLPASLSREVIGTLLRGDLGFSGLVVSDDLEMGAVADLDLGGAAAVAAMEAGCDLLLYCADLDRAERAAVALHQRACSVSAFAIRLDEARRAIDAFAGRWAEATAVAPAWPSAKRDLELASAAAQSDGELTV